VSAPSFDIFVGLTLFAVIYLTGVTSMTGAILAGILAPGGIFYVFLSRWVDPGGYYDLVSGLLLIDAAIRNPDGFAGRLLGLGRSVVRRFGRADRPGDPVPVEAQAVRDDEDALTRS
jgi:hypothetical protein